MIRDACVPAGCKAFVSVTFVDNFLYQRTSNSLTDPFGADEGNFQESTRNSTLQDSTNGRVEW